MRFYIQRMDGLSKLLGIAGAWALLLACLLSAGNALLRYSFNLGSNAWLEAQWYLFGFAVFAGAPMLLKLNEHVRVDVIYGSRSVRTKVWIDALGFALVLLPVCAIMTHLSIHFVMDSFVQQEHSPSAGGLLRWPIKAAIPCGFALLGMQALAELFKRVLVLVSRQAGLANGQTDLNPSYERPLQ